MPVHHPSDATLLAHAAGGLDEAYRAVVAAHLVGCPACRAEVRLAEQVGGKVLDALEEAPLEAGAREHCFARLERPEPQAALPPPPPTMPGLPPVLAGYGGRWRRLLPGLAIATLLPPVQARAGLHLMRIAPGMRLAAHGHAGLELTAILKGAFEDASGIYRAGDVAETDEADQHTPVATGDETCVCLIALSGKLRFDHWLARLMQPLFGV